MVTGRRSSALVAAVVVVLAGCSSDDPEELSLDDGSEVAAPEEGEPSGAEEPDEPTDEVEDVDGESQNEEQLYPPLPPLEPNPDSGIDEDMQDGVLALHAEVYEATQAALADDEYELESLRDYLADPALEQMVEGIEERREERLVSRSPDTEVLWVEVAWARQGPAAVHECRLVGPETGTYDADSHEPVQLNETTTAVIFETRYELLEIDDAIGYRAVEITPFADEDRCRA